MFIYELAQYLSISDTEAVTLVEDGIRKGTVFGFSEDVNPGTWLAPSEGQRLVSMYNGLIMPLYV